MKAIVLAAGRGERMRPLTDAVPKPLLTVAGKPLIAHHLEALARADVRDVVVNLSWLGEKIRAALGDGSAYGVRITYSEEGPVALETGGGIYRALRWLGPGPFLVVNGDTWTDFDLRRLELPEPALARLVLVANPPHHARGDFTLQGEHIADRESAGANAATFTYSGIGLYRPALFDGCVDGRFPLLPLLNRAIAARRLLAELHRGDWSDVGTPQRLESVRSRHGGA